MGPNMLIFILNKSSYEMKPTISRWQIDHRMKGWTHVLRIVNPSNIMHMHPMSLFREKYSFYSTIMTKNMKDQQYKHHTSYSSKLLLWQNPPHTIAKQLPSHKLTTFLHTNHILLKIKLLATWKHRATNIIWHSPKDPEIL